MTSSARVHVAVERPLPGDTSGGSVACTPSIGHLLVAACSTNIRRKECRAIPTSQPVAQAEAPP